MIITKLNRLSFLGSLSRDVRIIILSNALRNYCEAILAVTLPIYLSKIGATPILIGVTFTGIALFSALRSLIEGMVSDRIGRKPILLFIAASLVLGGLIFVFTTNLTVLLAAAILFTVGGTITYTPAELALLSEKVGDQSRTMALSVNSTVASVTDILGGFSGVVPVVLQVLGLGELAAYRVIFVIFTAVGATCLLLFSLIKEVKPEAQGGDKPDKTEGVGVDERRLLVKWSGVVALDGIGGSFNNLLNYWYYLRFGVGPAQIGVLAGISSIITLFSYTLGFRLAKRFGMIRAIIISRVPIFIINFLTPFMPSFTVVAVFRVFMSVFSNIDVPLRQSYILGVTRREARGSAYGVVQVVSRFTSAGAPALTGYIYQVVNLSFPFFGAASFQLASAVSMYLFFKDIKPPEEKV